MKWEPILYSCFGTRGRGYAFDVAGAEFGSVCDHIIDLRLPPKCWVVGAISGSVFFGQQGFVGERLGWDHRGARDQSGRKLEYFLGYVSSPNAGVPTYEDLVHLQQQVDGDLRRLADARWSSVGPIENVDSTYLRDFGRPKRFDSKWNEAADAIASGQSSITLVAAPGGEYFAKGPEKARFHEPVSAEEDHDANSVEAEAEQLKKNFGGGRQKPKTLALVLGLIALVMILFVFLKLIR